jgi:predicted Rossmann fold flavoprotein
LAERCEVVVVGGGAAGLLAAARAAERGRRTLLLEKNRKPGAKILMSGGTRCNITQNTDARGIVEAFGPQGRFLHSALAALSPADLVTLIEVEGVPTKIEVTGKIFPVSDKASDVLAALMRRLGRSGCELALDEPCVELARSDDTFQLVTSKRVLRPEKVILTTGGQSYPGCGTTGDGYRWLAALGHRIIPPRPALTPVTTNAPWVLPLKGVTIPDVVVRVIAENPACLAARRGSFLFTHFGLSGPVVLDVSRAITGHPQPGLELECDFLPAVRADDLEDHLRRECAADGKKQLGGIVARHLPRRLADAIVQTIGLSAGLKAAELSKRDRGRLVAAIKRTRIPVSGTRGFKKAEVTAGGAALDEIDSRTLQSKIVPNLFIAGEILDLDGPIGGYNFQAAFSTGYLAAESV